MSEPTEDLVDQVEAPPPFRVDAPGIYEMTAEQYHADPCPEPSLNSSIAWLLCDSSPLHARKAHRRLNPQHVEEEKESFDIGTAVHQFFLEGIHNVRVVDGVDDWRTKAAQMMRDELRAKGFIPMLRKHWSAISAMLGSTRAQLDAHGDGCRMFKDGRHEVVVIWTEDVAGVAVWCRARLDYLRTHGIDDLKSTRGTANPEHISRRMIENGWSMQAVHYAKGVERVTGEALPVFFAVQECDDPYALSVNALGPMAQMLAEKQWRFALETWARGLTSGVWPGYGDQTAFASVPPWVEAAWLEKEVRLGV